MKKLFILLIVLIVIGVIFVNSGQKEDRPDSVIPQQETPSKPSEANNEVPQRATIAEGLDTPWAIAFLPDGGILVTERPGRVRHISKDDKLDPNPVATLSQVREIGEGGLLGMALHPDFAASFAEVVSATKAEKATSGRPNFSSNRYIYFYYTFKGSGDDTFNRVVRMRYEGGRLGDEEIIVDNIPGSSNHNGGRIKFGPDNNLYITTGDAQDPSRAQDKSSLAGKILRVTDSGKPVSTNPFGDLVYSYGHRNPQGIDWDSEGRLWSTEHGRSGIQSGLDELNIVDPGKNYGWPDIQGDEKREGRESPVAHSGTSTTWAPAGAAFIEDSLFFGGLRGQTLYEAVIEQDNVTIKEHFKGEFGRVREVIAGPDGMLYITTSNQDGRGSPSQTDDRVIRVNPEKL